MTLAERVQVWKSGGRFRDPWQEAEQWYVTAREWWRKLLSSPPESSDFIISEGQIIEPREINYDAGVGQLIAFLCPAVSEHVNSVHEYFDDLFGNQVSQRKFPTMF